MENASKALIIAGSIIVSLVIVSLGIMIYRKVQTSTDVSGVKVAQVEGHNEEYEAYFGTYVSAANVKALLQKIKTNNTLYSATKGSDSGTMKVWVVYDLGSDGKVNDNAGVDQMTNVIKKIKASKHYEVQVLNEATSDDEDNADEKGYHRNGYIKTIKITYAQKQGS